MATNLIVRDAFLLVKKNDVRSVKSDTRSVKVSLPQNAHKLEDAKPETKFWLRFLKDRW